MAFEVIFEDRTDAGRALAERLGAYANRDDVLVLALPRGGVPVAFEVARKLRAPLDVFLVRKLGVPGQEELAMGAISSGGITVLNENVVRGLGIPREVIDRTAVAQREELTRRERLYRNHRPAPEIRGRCVLLIDDGLATGASMLAAVQGLRKHEPARIVVAVPVAAEPTCQRFQGVADEIVCMATPEPFGGVGQWYEDFRQTTDDEVRELLQAAFERQASGREE